MRGRAAGLHLGTGDRQSYWTERDTAQGLVRDLLESVSHRKRSEFLDARTLARKGKRTLRTDNGNALPASKTQRAQVRKFMRAFAAERPEPAFYRVIDVARRIAGTCSLGVERYVVVIRGEGSPDGNHLLDLKVSARSALRATLETHQPRWTSEAQRVADVQH